MSGVGGQNHIALELVAQAAGVDVTKMKIVGYSGGGDALTAVLGSHVELLVLPVWSVQAQSKLAVCTRSQRLETSASTVRFRMFPPGRNLEFNVSFAAWRGIIGPKAMPASEIAFWDNVLGKTVQEFELER